MAENKKNKKVLVASAILAAMIVASSSFAWFTSKDEVVNRLTAENKYAVTVTENFTPPSNWIPGQVVKKEAGAINTGNIDAFVKLTLSNEMALTTYDTPKELDAFKADVANNPNKYVTLSPNEVKSLQAGGRLACKAGANVAEADKRTGTGFEPGTDANNDNGLYIFERVTEYNADGSVRTKTYSGYYYVYDTQKGEKVYYSLANITPPTSDVNTFSAEVQTKKTVKVTPKLTYDKTNNKLVATHGKDDNVDDNDIIINIALADNHIKDWTNNTDTTEFYYKHILAAGAETGDLVKYVQIDSSVKNKAYINMDYSLKVTADSVQVTQDAAKTTAVNESGWALTATANGTDVAWT